MIWFTRIMKYAIIQKKIKTVSGWNGSNIVAIITNYIASKLIFLENRGEKYENDENNYTRRLVKK